MNNVDEIRAKILGVLIKDARIHAGRSIEESSQVMGVSAADFTSYEAGQAIPDMPFLEALSVFLHVPFERFWGDQTLGGFPVGDFEGLLNQRREGIAVQLKEMRESAGKSLAEVAKSAGIEEAHLAKIEDGTEAVNVFEAEGIARALSLAMWELQDRQPQSPLFGHEEEQKLMKQIRDMPDEMRAFIVQQVNHPYLQMAMKLSKMEVNRMRDFAEDILEITL